MVWRVGQCPANWRPGCSCSVSALEPSEDCYIHGCPDNRLCPYCGLFRSYTRPCKRCGCAYGIEAAPAGLAPPPAPPEGGG